MSSSRVVEEYSKSIKNLKKQCREAGMSEEEFKRIYYQSLKAVQITGNTTENGRFRRFVNYYRTFIICILVGFCFMYNFKSFYSTLMCNLQEYIYPGLKLLRQISIPLISLFPSLSDYYHETCLIQNPYFTVVDMDCWPCSIVTSVIEYDNPKTINEHQNTPFIYKTEQKVINMESLRKIYTDNKDTFNTESPKILTNNKYYQSPDDIFTSSLSDEKNFYIWKFQNLRLAKLLRQVIPRPKIVPKFGQSIERFIIIDKSQKSFSIPDTECNHSFLLALSGSREVKLSPAEECKHQCKSLTFMLKESYLLWYNWWYWRPAFQHSEGNMTFVAHVGSYCKP